MKSLRRQPIKREEGLTGISIIIMLAVASFFLAIVFALFPVYMEHFSVSTHVNGLKEEPDIANMTKREVIRKLKNRFQIDNVSSVTDDDIELEEVEGGYKLVVDYEVRKPFLGNVDIVVVFHDEVDITE